MFKTNDTLNPIINNRIIEYDIKSGNTSVMRYFKLYPEDEINRLENMKKQDRVVEIGKIMKKDKDFASRLEKSFNSIVGKFITVNGFTETDIVSIKRDAVFVKTKTAKDTTFGECVSFIPKNEYRGFIKIKNFEFWIGDKFVDVKGLNDSLLKLHEDGIISLILFIHDMCTSVNMDKVAINTYFVKNIIEPYRNREFGFNMYREFNSESKFTVNINGRIVKMDDMSEDFIDYCDISYNYINIIIPLIKLFC